MTLLVVGTDCAVARALMPAAPLAGSGATEAIVTQRPSELAVLALPVPAGPVGAMTTEDLAGLADATVTLAISAVRSAAKLETPTRIVIVCPADALHPDHQDGVRSVIGAGLTMLTEVAAALPGITINAIAVADDVPAEEVAALTRYVLSGSTPSLNGSIIRLDGGRDAVLAAETRAEGD